MKKKKSKILGVALTLMLVASLFAFAVPVSAAAPGPTTWKISTLPTATGSVMQLNSEPVDIAVANDGSTIYAINNLNNAGNTLDMDTAANAPNYHFYKSTNAGQSWTGYDLSGVTGAIAAPLGNVAVAPDDPNAVAISTYEEGSTTDTVFVSNDGGITWSALPAIEGATANAVIQDLAVAPARTGTVLTREYVIAVADSAAGVTLGDVQIIGDTYAWRSVAAATDGNADYMAVAISRNFIGDRSVAAVGAGPPPTPGSILHLINTVGAGAEIRQVTLNASVNDFGASANATLAADIALPSDWDPATSSGQRTYVSTASDTVAHDGVWRVDAGTARELGWAGTALKSVAYYGTIDEGKLFIGYWADTTVRHTINMTVATPTWTATKKVPTGADQALLRVAADYSTTSRVFAVTLGAESALSVSNDAGVSFDQVSLIDNGVVNDVENIDSVMLTPDGGTIFMATDDGTEASLWKSATPTSSTSWSRIHHRTATTATLVRLNPGWADNPTLFWVETGDTAGRIWVSTNGGSTFSTQNVPGVALQDAVAESNTILYVASANLVYKSTNAAFWFGTGKDSKAGTIISLAMAPTYPVMPVAGNLLVGGTGAVSYSTDGGATFTKISTGLAATSTIQIIADEDYATNNTLYAGDSLSDGTANTFRFEIGSSQWNDLATLAVADADEVVGLGTSNGVLYSVSDAVFGTPRTLNPRDTIGTITWETADQDIATPGALAAGGSPNILTIANNVLYVPDRTAGDPVLWGLEDTLATVKPVITSPAEGTTIAVDPITGYGAWTTITWEPIGSGNGLVNRYEMRVYSDAEGWAGAATTGIDTVGNLQAPSRTVGGPNSGADAQASWLANTEYVIQVRARNVVGGPTGANTAYLRSGWSDPVRVSIQAGGVVQAPQAGVILLGPAAGATNVSLTPGFSWAPISGATEYEFILALDASLTNTVEGTPVSVTQPSWQVPSTTLEYSTTYFWAVKATQPTVSVQSIGTFITMAEPVVPPPPPPPVEPPPIPEPITPTYIWAIIIIGAILMIAVIILIVRTRRVV